MPGTYLNYDFDNELFVESWGQYPDPVRNALIQSGVMVTDPVASSKLQSHGNYVTIPFYKPITGSPANFDGQTDVPIQETEGGSMSAVAYGRTQGWKERDFQPLLYGNDPMGNLVSHVAKFWQTYDQRRLLDVIKAALGVSAVSNHTATIARPTNKEELPALINMKLAEIFGENKDMIRMFVTSSVVAAELENLNLLVFDKGVDAGAMIGDPRIGHFLGRKLIVDDGAMTKTGQVIFALGRGALITADVAQPVQAELERHAVTNGGETVLVTRRRNLIHPNGFSFTKPSSSWTESPTDAQLAAKANYSLVYPEDQVPIAMITLSPAVGG